MNDRGATFKASPKRTVDVAFEAGERARKPGTQRIVATAQFD